MTPTIHLVFVDDWEIRGDGSGDPRKLQFKPMRQLTSMFNERGIRGSFNAEMMQQLSFRAFQDKHPELRQLAEEWDDEVRETYAQGHDIQLHIHTQWLGAQYEGGKWFLPGDWSLLKHDPVEARSMLEKGKRYLEGLLRPINPEYRCVSYRAGSWCIAPSDFALPMLAELGILLDLSIVSGIEFHTRRIDCDYTHCEEGFLPYYPVMQDARRLDESPQPMICVPTNSFRPGPWWTLGRDFRKVTALLRGRIRRTKKALGPSITGRDMGYTEWEQRNQRFSLLGYLDKKYLSAVSISDLAQLDSAQLALMLKRIRERARRTGLKDVPIVLENHTKDIRDFSHIKKFLDVVAAAPDLRTITLTELADRLVDGTFQVRTKNSTC